MQRRAVEFIAILVLLCAAAVANAETFEADGSVSSGEWNHFGPFEADSGAFTVSMTGDHDADLYVREGAQPTTSAFDCRPYNYGSNESCSMSGPGTFYVSVRGYAYFSNYHINVTYTEAGSTPPSATAETILFVSSGYYQQESDIYYHLIDKGYIVEVVPGHQINGGTDLSPYAMAIVTGFDNSLYNPGRENIKSNGLPVLIVEYWDFWHSYKFDLLKWDSGDYYGTTTVEIIDSSHPITEGIATPTLDVYSPSYVLYGASMVSIEAGVTPLIYSWSSADEVAVLADDTRKIAATGIYDTTHYTADAWNLFDRMVGWLMPVSVEHAWSGAPTDTSIYVKAVSAPDGNTLAYTSYGDVYKVDDLGAASLLVSGSGDTSGHRVVLNPAGDTFLIKDDGTLSLYKHDGVHLGTLSIADALYARPITGTELILVPLRLSDDGDGESENPFVGARIIDATGVLQSEFASDGLAGLEITSERMVYLTTDEIVVMNMEGTELWRASQRVESFDTSEDASKLIVEDGADTTRVVHFDGDTPSNDVSLGEAVWNVAISPDGAYSAATTKNAVHIFHDGVLHISKTLPVAFTASLDVSNHGEVTVGGKNADSTSHLFLLNRHGMIIWEEETGIVDRYGWRPDISFQNDGEAISSRTKIGIDFFNIERGL